MKTEDLIAGLAKDVEPIRRNAAEWTLLAGVAAGMVVSFAIMIPWLGLRPDLSAAVMTMSYWMKFAYTGAIALLAFWLADRLARPGMPAGTTRHLIFVPFLPLAIVAIVELLLAPPNQVRHMIMGGSARACPWLIVVLSLPIFAGTFARLRNLAPTRLGLAGAAAGALAGAAGAWVYAFHCGESAAPFVVTWYTLGIVAVSGLGALFGRWTLRW